METSAQGKPGPKSSKAKHSSSHGKYDSDTETEETESAKPGAENSELKRDRDVNGVQNGQKRTNLGSDSDNPDPGKEAKRSRFEDGVISDSDTVDEDGAAVRATDVINGDAWASDDDRTSDKNKMKKQSNEETKPNEDGGKIATDCLHLTQPLTIIYSSFTCVCVSLQTAGDCKRVPVCSVLFATVCVFRPSDRKKISSKRRSSVVVLSSSDDEKTENEEEEELHSDWDEVGITVPKPVSIVCPHAVCPFAFQIVSCSLAPFCPFVSRCDKLEKKHLCRRERKQWRRNDRRRER